MKIRGNEAENVSEMLKEALLFGQRYVSLNPGQGNEYFRADSMQYFGTKAEVQYHQYDSIGQQHKEALPVLSLLEQLQRKMELHQMTKTPGSEPRDITIDTSRIRYLERTRTEVFTEQISRQLREQNIRLDVKQLREHIDRDDPSFTIKGRQHEDGQTKSYIIHIEQNEHRAFSIRDIAPQKTFHQERGLFVIDVTGSYVRKEDTLGIRDMMRNEMENGYRFVSFLSGQPGLTKEDFTTFKTPFEAHAHAYENSTDYDKYVVRPTALIEKEINRLIEMTKDQHTDKPRDNERQDKPTEHDRQAKPSRDQDRSR